MPKSQLLGRVKDVLSVWCPIIVGKTFSPVALDLKLVGHVLALVHVLSFSKRIKDSACRDVRLQCYARARCLLYFCLRGDRWSGVGSAAPRVFPQSKKILATACVQLQ